MKLLKLRVAGFRRFEEPSSLLVTDRLVAVVGPNESGKSSLLRALRELNGTGKLPSELSTRQSSASPQIEALFEIEPEDEARLAEVRGGDAIKRAWFVRSSSGSSWKLENEPTRDLQPRQDALAEALSIAADPALDPDYSNAEHQWTEETWTELVEVLSSEVDSLTDAQRLVLGQAANALNALEFPLEPAEDFGSEEDRTRESGDRQAAYERRVAVASVLHALGVDEAAAAPRRIAREILNELKPSFVLFKESFRTLLPEYDLEQLVPDDQVPPALKNLAALADLDLATLYAAIDGSDHGTTELLLRDANVRLRSEFDLSWTQSNVCVQLRTDNFFLRVLVEAEGGGDYTPIDYRSDGMHWFIALRAFLAQRDVSDPILLIDEVETHLHYAAQADLVDVLNRQRLARQVIYTTHSAGALPPDLGTGVRAVVPLPNSQRSSIDNSFWTAGPGYTSLLMGMGASTLAFAVPRRLLLTEGASDAILLPTLLRHATGLPELPYRIAPGISNTPPEDRHRLDEEAGRVAYLVDGDGPGLALKQSLLDAKVPKSRVRSFADFAKGQPVTLEDLIDIDAYLAAVNQELQPFAKKRSITAGDLTGMGRGPQVASWCKHHGIAAPSKMRVVQRLLEAFDERDPDVPTPATPLLTSHSIAWLKKLHTFALRALMVSAEESRS